MKQKKTKNSNADLRKRINSFKEFPEFSTPSQTEQISTILEHCNIPTKHYYTIEDIFKILPHMIKYEDDTVHLFFGPMGIIYMTLENGTCKLIDTQLVYNQHDIYECFIDTLVFLIDGGYL